MNSELKKYKLIRKNKYYECIGKGVIFLMGVYITSGLSCLYEEISNDSIVNIMGYESWIITLSTLGISFVKTIPETRKINKIKSRKTNKKTK